MLGNTRLLLAGSLGMMLLLLAIPEGVPDLDTRMLVRFLWQTLGVPVYALVDADPYGIEIMCTYRFGSLALSHLSDQLAAPSIRWLGVLPSDIDALSLPSAPLSPRDVAKIHSLLGRPYTRCLPGLERELRLMLERGRKAGIEGINSVSPRYLATTYLQDRMNRSEDCI